MTLKSISQLFDLTGKGAIVTGGGKGIGHAISLRLAEAGAGIMIADIDVDSAEETAREIQERGGKARTIKADAKSASDAVKVVDSTTEAFGSIDILVNNAGIFPFSPVLELTEEMWDQVLNINLKGVFLYSKAVALAMAKSGNGGKIVNLASIDSFRPSGMLTHYDASKGGVLMLTKAMAKEFGPMRIHVNAVAPGSIETIGARNVMSDMSKSMGMAPDRIMSDVLRRTPLGRLGEPDDIARVVLFLASEAAAYITGEVIVVDGGYLLG